MARLMRVPVTREQPCDEVVEVCVICGKHTCYWWGNGCSPLCKTCAGSVTHERMVSVSKRLRLGPIPEE